MASDDADWVNGPVEEVDQDEIDASAAEEAEAADWINGPPDDEPSVIQSDTGSHVAPANATTPEQVSVPALEEADDVLAGGGTPDDDPGDHRGQPWSTDLAADAGTRTASRTGAAHMSEPVAARSQQPFGRDEPLDVEPVPEPSGSEAPPLDEPRADEEPEAAEAPVATEEPTAADQGPTRERRISEYDEVHDGGYGVGSAAPLGDGAQPLGHAVKGYRESNTFVAPGDQGYDEVEPDVWFFNEEAARRAGFNRAGE